MEALGAKCIRVPQVEGIYGLVTYADSSEARKVSEQILEETGAYFVRQFYNEANVEAHYHSTGPEIWMQTGSHVDAFVATVGTAGTFAGTSKYLKEQNAEIKCYECCEILFPRPNLTRSSLHLIGRLPTLHLWICGRHSRTFSPISHQFYVRFAPPAAN